MPWRANIYVSERSEFYSFSSCELEWVTKHRKSKLKLCMKSLEVETFVAYKVRNYPRKEISTPAATADPITPETLLAMQYCRI